MAHIEAFILIGEVLPSIHATSGVARERASSGGIPPPTIGEMFSPVNLRCYIILVYKTVGGATFLSAVMITKWRYCLDGRFNIDH